MNKRTVIIITAICLVCLAAAFIYGLPRGISSADAKTASAEPTLSPTIAPTPAPTSEATSEPTPEQTAAPTPEPTPTPEPPLLVNFDNPMFDEPEVVPLKNVITAENVTIDSRRHADMTAAKALNRMLITAEREGDFSFIIASAFRSIEEQGMLWDYRVSRDPDYGADPYSEPVIVMPPGCSEHVTGLAFDILCASCPHAEEYFESTPEGVWLAENAHRFGFILRYPADKQHLTGVKYEPWHFRYVGMEAAEYMYEHGLCLEEYAELLMKDEN